MIFFKAAGHTLILNMETSLEALGPFQYMLDDIFVFPLKLKYTLQTFRYYKLSNIQVNILTIHSNKYLKNTKKKLMTSRHLMTFKLYILSSLYIFVSFKNTFKSPCDPKPLDTRFAQRHSHM